MNRAYLPFLKILRRVPDDIILAVVLRDINTSSDAAAPNTCLCGWVYREWLARLSGLPAEDITWASQCDEGARTSRPARLAKAFGGSARAWETIFLGICDSRQGLIEEAFARRVDEAVAAGVAGKADQ